MFIPFLEDSTYAVHDGLPVRRHECNYTSERALLIQPLPYSFSIQFGIVQGAQLAEGQYAIEIHQSRPAI